MLNNVIRGIVVTAAVVSTAVVLYKINKAYKEAVANKRAEEVSTEELLASSKEYLRKAAAARDGIKEPEGLLKSHMQDTKPCIVGKEWINGNGGWIIPRHNAEIQEGSWTLHHGDKTALLIRNKLSIILAYEDGDVVKVLSNDSSIRNQHITQGLDNTLINLKRQLASKA